VNLATIVAAAEIREPLIYCMASVADGTSTPIYVSHIRGCLAFRHQYISIPQDMTAILVLPIGPMYPGYSDSPRQRNSINMAWFFEGYTSNGMPV